MRQAILVLALLLGSPVYLHAQLAGGNAQQAPPATQQSNPIQSIALEHDIMDRQMAIALELDHVSRLKAGESDPDDRQLLAQRELLLRLLIWNKSSEQQQALRKLIAGPDAIPMQAVAVQLSQALDVVPLYRQNFASSLGSSIIFNNLLCAMSAAPANDPLMLDLVDQSIWIGEYTFAPQVSDIKGPGGIALFNDYPFAQLKARAAMSAFLELADNQHHQGSWPDREETQQFKQLSRDCQVAFEEAFKLAPTDNEKLLVVAEWMRLLKDSYYDADSKELRDFVSSRLNATETTPAYQAQLKAFSDRVDQVIPTVHDAEKWTPENRSACAHMLNTEFAWVARVGIPDEVFQQILADLPIFIDEQFTPADPKCTGINSNTLRWYLWEAVTLRMPTPQQRRSLDRSLNQVIAALQVSLDTTFADADMQQYRTGVADRLRREYAHGQTSRLDPFHKLPLLPHQQQRRIPELINDLNEYSVNCRRSLNGNPIDRSNWIQREASFHTRGLYRFASSTLTIYTNPIMGLPLPDTCVVGTASTFNSRDIWIMEITKAVPAKPYPKQGEFLDFDKQCPPED